MAGRRQNEACMKRKSWIPDCDPESGRNRGAPKQLFSGDKGLFVPGHVQPQRLQIWIARFQQLGGLVKARFSKSLTHIFAADRGAVLERVDWKKLRERHVLPVKYEWIQDCLEAGARLPVDKYVIPVEGLEEEASASVKEFVRHDTVSLPRSPKRSDTVASPSSEEGHFDSGVLSDESLESLNSRADKEVVQVEAGAGGAVESAERRFSAAVPVCQNEKITAIFDELSSIYKEALGDDRRSFSYHKAVSTIEKLPFQIASVEQVKGLPGIGKRLQEHIQEILETGTLSKLEHFKTDEKVRTMSLFGSVWGIGPATALRLYEKGHRTLKDLMTDESLTQAQRLGLIYHDDITKRIPRHEVAQMEALVQKAAEEIRPGIVVVCGGSYRRGRATVGDIDLIVTHPDGKGHVGFLRLLVQKLKEMDFITEDLLFGEHSIQGTDKGVDTFFGLCKYPGREQRHRIDLKVYPVDQYPFGLIAWTGNDVLNRRLRLIAASKGYKLDDHGLFPALRDASGQKGAQGRSGVKCKTERDVFDALGFLWLEPEQRNV